MNYFICTSHHLSILLFVYQIKITKEGETATAMINDEDGFEHGQSTGNMVNPDVETLLRKKIFIVFQL